MSALYVRNTVRAWCEVVAAAVAVPFYDTINKEQSPSDNVWWTVEFIANDREGTYCAETYAERGFVTVIVSARPGIGDEEAVVAIQNIMDELHLKRTDTLQLEFVEPFFEDSFGSADQSYRVGALLPYLHSN